MGGALTKLLWRTRRNGRLTDAPNNPLERYDFDDLPYETYTDSIHIIHYLH